ncbi:MAG: hypothetical protein MZV65_32855 [Chromatiales bacterium]|nr:hypothetical protein [Chromatiales bacterium]
MKPSQPARAASVARRRTALRSAAARWRARRRMPVAHAAHLGAALRRAAQPAVTAPSGHRLQFAGRRAARAAASATDRARSCHPARSPRLTRANCSRWPNRHPSRRTARPRARAAEVRSGNAGALRHGGGGAGPGGAAAASGGGPDTWTHPAQRVGRVRVAVRLLRPRGRPPARPPTCCSGMRPNCGPTCLPELQCRAAGLPRRACGRGRLRAGSDRDPRSLAGCRRCRASREPADDEALGAWLRVDGSRALTSGCTAPSSAPATEALRLRPNRRRPGAVAPRRLRRRRRWPAIAGRVARPRPRVPAPRGRAADAAVAASRPTAPGCVHRSPADAELHAYLQQVAGASRALFEAALERVARHEGLPLR